ncbi:UDP-N-acetylmuramoyl-tripeptide--D-alanyl-D-alanine ligase [Paenibacillus qinlingensis]|uniref:UDP-N-acetylmuramoyl-tripeptide--D-alanyl-D-alanine ligase n=1 Tax=Paenibacillus qinlingensis TaxID=1837343 RepID=A0ABU1NRU3_9BACL|nr:UDP-N-acetylmuramoyl-tripeptide--D-alanyl-D-alanine ligase [Paenibacillus qinlingensis]MDR6550194.1 UDP-N-acetylmuramoyl-tripeptide--D-alanyl-D-alanine ligase [Paenibacillus qinlingensis]
MICHNLKVIEMMTAGSGLSVGFEDLMIHGVSIDSRTVKSRNLFIPIIRELDGHDFVEEAISRGATASLWQKDHPNPPVHLPLIYVDDCLNALQTLAANYRRELSIQVIAVTGSNGKTTTKDMINSVLQTTYSVHKTAGNLNSQIGVPLTILEIDQSSEVAVIEMGMSERGQIDRLSRIAQPDIAVITMIGVSHLSSLGSREAIAAAKLEITNGLQDHGVLIYNGDEPLLTHAVAKINKPISTFRFGEGDSNDYYAGTMLTNSEGSFFTVGDDSFHLPVLGAHNISNALATIAVATILGIGPNEINAGFSKLIVTGMRMEKIISPFGYTIINDAWNASPNSMRAAIRTFEDLTGYGRKFVVLGDMLELGEQEEEFHREIGRHLDSAKIDYVYTVGSLGNYIAVEAGKSFQNGHVRSFLDKEALTKALRDMVNQDDIILLKASRGVRLETILKDLL